MKAKFIRLLRQFAAWLEQPEGIHISLSDVDIDGEKLLLLISAAEALSLADYSSPYEIAFKVNNSRTIIFRMWRRQ